MVCVYCAKPVVVARYIRFYVAWVCARVWMSVCVCVCARVCVCNQCYIATVVEFIVRNHCGVAVL